MEKKEEFEKDLEDTGKRQEEVLALQKNRKDEQKQLQRLQFTQILPFKN